MEDEKASPLPSPLHIRLVTYDDDPPEGGQGVYCRDLRQALEDKGVRVSTTAGRGRFRMHYARITGRGHIDLSIALNMRPETLASPTPHIIHFSGGPGGVDFVRRLDIPVVYTAHHTYRQAHSRLHLRRLMSLAEVRSYRLARVVAAVSSSTARSVIESGIPAKKVVLIRQGIRLPDLSPDIKRDPRRLLFVGRLESEKGPLDAIAAMRGVIERFPDSRGSVIGVGSLTREISSAVNASEGKIRYLGHVPDDVLNREYQRAAIVLMPSRYEGAGIVALEAMAHGAVVVGYDVLGLQDTVADNGILVSPGNVSVLTGACLDLLAHPGRKSELAAQALEAVRSERSLARFAQEFEDLYRQVMA